MEALNAAGLTPVSVLSKNRTTEPKKAVCFPSTSFKPSNSASVKGSLSHTFNGSLALLSSILTSGLAQALTYEEALQQSLSSPSSSDFDASNAITFATENPVVLAGGALVLAVPLILSQAFKKPKAWGVESAKKAYALLGDDQNSQLLDIRAVVELRKVGSPDLRGFKKKAVSIVYKGEDKPGFLKKLSLKFKEPENTTLFILDKFDGNSELVAELVTVNGFKAAYAIKDGAEGPKGWLNSSLPWIQPSKAFSFDLSSFTDAFSVGDDFDALPITVAIAAAAGLGALAFTEIETILQVLGSAAIIQFTSKKLLFSEDRKKTLKQVDEFLNTKIAPQELADDIKDIGKALLPPNVTFKSLPPPAEVSSEPAENTVQKAEASAPAAENTAQKAEATAEPATPINSVKAEAVSGFSRPLSPYAAYPDLKPPTSPTPSQP
ncbi:rhodanese-like domain-containing protein 4, chloroplastic isoform X2 [Mercurialis annua]|uniref:rhodanese-like domain-containing protein 4, chloroplastic isoform X2 n=1 Tax=Mercurialis annua TaxID=3986 RepID=UPI00215F4C50|nr:rhodanese-like domain-containing protein 4, chloroplastic isoform X2 [Mercurialis annua]